MATTMGFAQVGFLVLLCLSFCSARRVLTEATDVPKPNFARSFQATRSTSGLKSAGGISSLDDSKWQSGGKGSHCSGGGGGGGGGSGGSCCGGNEGCDGCGSFGGGSYCGGCEDFGCGGGAGAGSSYCGGNGGCGCGYACGGGGGGNYQGQCYCPPPPTCSPVTCPPVSNCCPVGCQPGYGHPKVAAQNWANSQAPPRLQITLTGNIHDVQPGYEHPEVAAHYWANSQVPPSPKVGAQHWVNWQTPPRPEITLTGNNQDHDGHKTNTKETEIDEIHSQPRFNADNDPKPNYSEKERELEQKTEIDSKNEPTPPGSDGRMQEHVFKNESIN